MIRTYARKKHKDENAAGANNKGEADPANPKAKKKTYGGRRNHRKVPELSPPKSKDGGRSASPEGGPFSISGPKEAEGAPASKSPSASPSFVLFRDRVDSTFDRYVVVFLFKENSKQSSLFPTANSTVEGMLFFSRGQKHS